MLPSLTHLDAKVPTPKKRFTTRNTRQSEPIPLSEPVSQEMARALFRLASRQTSKGFYGAVRRLNLNTVSVKAARSDITSIAIKKSDVTTETRMEVTYNEYLKQRDVYACIESTYPNDILHFTYPFEMIIPCERVRHESRSYFKDIAAPKIVIQLPEEVDEEDDEEDDQEIDEEILKTSCDSASGYVYTIQGWGCSSDEISMSLEEVYDRLTPLALSMIGRDIGRALWCLHSCEYLHRDLALRNILVCRTPMHARALIIDFGIAKRERAPLGVHNFWYEMRLCIDAIHRKQNAGTAWGWEDYDKFKGKSAFIDAAFQSYTSSFSI